MSSWQRFQYCSFITSHLHACPHIVPHRISHRNKIFHERACVAFTRHETYHAWTTTLDLLYHVWTINKRLITYGQLTVPRLDNPHENL